MRTQSRQKLTPELLLRAYADGYFPMAESRGGPIAWYSPDPRAIIPLDRLKISRSLRQTARKEQYAVRFDTSFVEVMRQCAEREETWISEEIVEAYSGLFAEGHAHSVETWKNDRLVGGLYGISMGGAFFGESMFSRETGASKIALLHLVSRLRERGFLLLDTQFLTPHLASLGACEIPRDNYMVLLREALHANTTFTQEYRGM